MYTLVINDTQSSLAYKKQRAGEKSKLNSHKRLLEHQYGHTLRYEVIVSYL